MITTRSEQDRPSGKKGREMGTMMTDDQQTLIGAHVVVVRRGKGNSEPAGVLEKNGKVQDRLDLLMETIRKAANEKFTGYIKVNFSQGSIGRVEKFEEILRK